MATLEEKLEAGTFVITAEVTPPLSASPDALLEAAAPLRGLVDAVNVTDAPGARATMSSFAAAAILAGNGFEPILQTTCRDRNRIAMAGDLLGAAAQGVRNLLVLHGDDPQAGDMPEAKPVYDLDSRGVMALARDMRETGTLPSGREIRPAPHFFIGCADTPFDPPDDFTPAGLEAKIAAGARFAQTQFCFEPQVAGRYFGWLADHGVTARLRIIAGIGPLRSAGQARYMNENLFGVSIPDSLIDRLERAADPRAEGEAACVDLMQALAAIDGVSGLHVMAPMQDAEAIARVIRKSGLR